MHCGLLGAGRAVRYLHSSKNTFAHDDADTLLKVGPGEIRGLVALFEALDWDLISLEGHRQAYEASHACNEP